MSPNSNAFSSRGDEIITLHTPWCSYSTQYRESLTHIRPRMPNAARLGRREFLPRRRTVGLSKEKLWSAWTMRVRECACVSVSASLTHPLIHMYMLYMHNQHHTQLVCLTLTLTSVNWVSSIRVRLRQSRYIRV